MRSNHSNNSSSKGGNQNRTYSPSGRMRNSKGISPAQPVNRVRREAAVTGSLNANSRSNS